MRRACVTGGGGFLASHIVRQLLLKGYQVNATVRHKAEDDDRLCNSHLNLFEADLEDEGSFDAAVRGCDFVFLVAAPTNAASRDPEEELIKPAIQGVLNVMRSCLKAQTVRRVVYTSSAASVSVNRSLLQDAGKDGCGCGAFVVDETWWSDTDYLYAEKPPTWGYIVSKVNAEKEALKFAEVNNIDLVTVAPVLLIGPALTVDLPFSLRLFLSLLPGGDPAMVEGLKTMQRISGSISMVSVEDAARAHIFLAELAADSDAAPSTGGAGGRYICCAVNTSLQELAAFLSVRYPRFPPPFTNTTTTTTEDPHDFSDLPSTARLQLSSQKLAEAGFVFQQQTLEDICDRAVEYLRLSGHLHQ